LSRVVGFLLNGLLAKAFLQTHVWPTSYSCLEFPRTARTGNWFPRMENAGNPASENLQWRKLVSENPVCRKLGCRELRMPEARFQRRTLLGNRVNILLDCRLIVDQEAQSDKRIVPSHPD